ncbi:MAG: HPr family phosphocarrier protein [Desulfohalobiaceae bacterium]
MNDNKQEEHYSTHLKVSCKFGLHARVAGRLVQEAQKCSSRILICYADQKADAKSIIEILMLAIGQGCTIEVSALGRDAMQAVQRITACLQEE